MSWAVRFDSGQSSAARHSEPIAAALNWLFMQTVSLP